MNGCGKITISTKRMHSGDSASGLRACIRLWNLEITESAPHDSVAEYRLGRLEQENRAREHQQSEQRRQALTARDAQAHIRLDLNFPRPMTGREHFSRREKIIIKNEENGRPSWARILPDYKFDWSVTRDRDLSTPRSPKQSIG